ncbi:MAG TPA: GGDEF domain-containing protein [Candidatus Polarisedimenticolia bacterium]|nr:GGDEF domain-containing protein [Candidatus Polarisedimenticolia bacterium]
MTAGRPGSPGRLAALAGLLASIVVIGRVDVLTGPDFGFSLFYLAPVAASAWWMGGAGAVVCAVAAGAAWVAGEVATSRDVHAPALAWNGFTRLAIYAAVGLLTARVRGDRSRLTALLDREKTLARTDPMTGLMNYRGFVESLLREASRCRRAGQAMCVAYIDLDNFKQINDRYGHSAGDALLSRIARTVQETIRAGDVPARIGGDEFVVMFWDVDRRAVEGIAQRIIDRVREAGAEYPLASLGASVGIAFFETPPESTEEILLRADNAMYEAKAMGKGLMAVWSGGSAPTAA